MTNEELAPLIDDAKVRALHKLQSPPILAPRKPIKGILEENIQIKDFDTANYVFTDITFGINDRERFIVVREPNGILRKATWEERDHMNQIYFPKEKRELRVPKMFDEEYFQDALEKGRHIFVLNRIIVQFEPDHPDYLKHMFRVFDHLILHSKLETIRSTRYFGTCVLYCALRGNVDDILLYILKDMGKTPTSYDNLDTKLESISLKPSNAAIKASYLTVQLYDIAQEQLYSTFNKTKSDNNISTINSCPIENDQDLTLNTRLLENDDTEPLLFQILNYVKKRRDNKSLHKVIGKDDIKLRELTDIIKVLLNTEDDLENQRQL
ncbi:unnamed protein product [Gordionus sp. m RMFG-2023]|uniref:small ribosomal subunit protein mS22-like n=1 Tax=Gordionus sp. m RMFG-2023 TaxID=3053472 RepID=UPI0030E5B8A6